MEHFTSKGEEVSTAPNVHPSHPLIEDLGGDVEAAAIVPQRQKRRKRHHEDGDHFLFSDPLDGTSSDEMSFDEEDMFGSDSDAETVSLAVKTNKKKRSFNEHAVCINILAQLAQLC